MWIVQLLEKELLLQVDGELNNQNNFPHQSSQFRKQLQLLVWW